jgi:hypothetical protein
VLVRLLVATRRQLWRAVAALESKPHALRESAGTIWVLVVAWPVRGLTVVVWSVWRSMRAALRLVFALRVLWP